MGGFLFAAGGFPKYAAVFLMGCAALSLLIFGVLAIKNKKAYVSRKAKRWLRLLFKKEEITGTWAVITGLIQIAMGLFLFGALGVFLYVDSALHANNRRRNLDNVAQHADRYEDPIDAPALDETNATRDPDSPEDAGPEFAGVVTPEEKDDRQRESRSTRPTETNLPGMARHFDRIADRAFERHQEQMRDLRSSKDTSQRESLDVSPEVEIGPIDMASLIVEWQKFGRQSGNVFETKSNDGSVLVGLAYGVSEDGYISHLRSIFQSGNELFYGAGGAIGRPGALTDVIAPPGSVVSSIEISAERNDIVAFRLAFGTLDGDTVQSGREQSDWIGEPSNRPSTVLDGNGRPIVAITGTYRRAFNHLGIGVAVQTDPPLGSPASVIPHFEYDYADTKLVMPPGPAAMALDRYDMAPPNGILVGFQLGVDDRRGAVTQFRPVFQVDGKYALGSLHGDAFPSRSKPQFTNIVADPGYAVSGCEMQAGVSLSSISIQFAKLDGAKLDMADAYASEPIGQSRRIRREPVDVSTNGELAVGVIASRLGSRGFGLVAIPEAAVKIGVAPETPADPIVSSENLDDHSSASEVPADSSPTDVTAVEKPPLEHHFREWTSTSGKTITAKFVRRDGDKIVLESKKGKQARIGIVKLSQTDQDYVAELSD